MAGLEDAHEGFGLCPLRVKQMLGGQMVEQGARVRDVFRTAGARQHRGMSSV